MIDAKAEWTPTMTDEEMVLFDLKGYIVFPAVLSADEIALIKEQCEKLRQDKQSSCTWTQETPRIALFFLYNHINVRHSRPNFSDEMLASLSAAHRRFFNEVYHPQFDNANWDKSFEVPTTNAKPVDVES